MLNSVCFGGRLTADPDFRYTPNGTPVCTFTLAIKRDYKDKNGEYQTDFINCVTWKQTAELVAKFVQKGHMINGLGRMESRTFESDGRKVYVTEGVLDKVFFLEPKKDNDPNVSKHQQYERR
jgi:single-strand DNA-binding protein